MKKLIIMSGPPASGKSTLIKELGLEHNTLCPDTLKLMFSGTEIMNDGNIGIYQRDNYKVFKELFNILENRMQYGLITVIDACHTTERDIEKYRVLATKYNYEVVLVNFKVEKDELLKRNKNREFSVPEEVIERMYSEKQNIKYPSYIRKISPKALADEIRIRYTDLSKYKRIIHIGDVHGCYTALKEAIGTHIGFDEFLVFHGDYIDRGLENVETLKFLFSIMRRPNVIFLKGNHELNLCRYVNGEETYGKAFDKTKVEIEESSITLKELKEFCNRLQNFYSYNYKGQKVFCTHGGISSLNGVELCSEYNFIVGSGQFDDDIDEIWNENVKGTIQIHGHRNEAKKEIKATYNSFNLEGGVENGQYLRIINIDSKGISGREVKNNVFNQALAKADIEDEDL